jgi:outer membrane protein assembly factor BamB
MCGLTGFGVMTWVPLLIKQGWLSVPPQILYEDSINIGGCAIAIFLWCTIQAISRKSLVIVPHRLFPFVVLSLAILSFIVANFIGTKDQYIRAVICIDRNDGMIQWKCEGLVGPKKKTHRANSAATPTPVIHNQHVYAYFGTPGLMCTDLKGNMIWSNRDLPYEGIHGVGASPIACDGYIFVTSLNSKAPYITALDCNTGERIWTSKIRGWSGIHGEYRTPLIIFRQDKKALVNWCRSHNELTAYDIHSGKELWKCHPKGDFEGESVASILWGDDMLYLPSRSDIAAIKLLQADKTVLPTAVWNTNMHGRGPIAPSPVLSEGMLFMVSDHGYASCLNAANGEILWQKKLPGNEYLASPIVMGDHVYFWNSSGVTTVVACDRTFKKIAQNTLPGGIVASPAPVNGQLFVRTTKALWCIE